MSLIGVIGSAARRRLVPAGYQAEVIADSPVAYYRLGETSGTTAVDEIGSYNGTYTNGPALGATGAVGNCVSLDGVDDFVDLPNLGINGAAARSVEFFVNPDSSGAGIDTMYCGSGTASALRTGFAIHHSAAVANNCYVSFVGRDVYSGSNTVPRNAWTHVVVTYDGSAISTTSVIIYINGVAVATTLAVATAGAANTTSAVSAIGRDLSFGGRDFKGLLDEFAVYDSVLSAARVAAHYTASGL